MKRSVIRTAAAVCAAACLLPGCSASTASIPAGASFVQPLTMRISLTEILSGLFSNLFSKDEKSEKDETEETEKQSEKKKNPDGYESPVDFAALQKENPDVYAWLEITDSDISYPVLNHEGDNSYYLTHDSRQQKDTKGSVYTEDFNTKTFDDPTTLIYGHTTKNGEIFGTLQKKYTDSSFFKTHREIKVYLPDKEYTYKVFAAIPFSDVHILYYYDFTNEKQFNSFYNTVFSTRSLDAIVDSDVDISMDDHVIVLSTCIASDRSKRFLVLAVRETVE